MNSLLLSLQIQISYALFSVLLAVFVLDLLLLYLSMIFGIYIAFVSSVICKKIGSLILDFSVIEVHNFIRAVFKNIVKLTLDVSKRISSNDLIVISPPKLLSFNIFAVVISVFLVGDDILKTIYEVYSYKWIRKHIYIEIIHYRTFQNIP